MPDVQKKEIIKDDTQGAWFTTKYPLHLGFMTFGESPIYNNDSLLNDVFVNKMGKEIPDEEFDAMRTGFHAGIRMGYAFRDIVEPAIEAFRKKVIEITEEEIRDYHEVKSIFKAEKEKEDVRAEAENRN